MRSSRIVSTHLPGSGYSIFQVRDSGLEYRKGSSQAADIQRKWITGTGLIAFGLENQPYLHLDIRTPFGETVTDHQVEAALSENLGPRRDKFRMVGWHIQFVEDTNLGSDHRVFIDLADSAAPAVFPDGVDVAIPIELAVEALGEIVRVMTAEPSFQLLVSGTGHGYSVLFQNGSPFHVLRVPERGDESGRAKLIRHREFLYQARNGANGLRAFAFSGDALLSDPTVAVLKLERLELGHGTGMVPESVAQDIPQNQPLHLGVAWAARHIDFSGHNRVPDSQRRKNAVIRSRHRFAQATAATAVVCLLVAAGLAVTIHVWKAKLDTLAKAASGYQKQVDAIRKLRAEKSVLEMDLAALHPLWNNPINWAATFTTVASALPKESGIDGLVVTRLGDGALELSFRAWVRDWNQVQAIQKKLDAAGTFSAVTLSEQRKDLASGVVIFHVTCRM